MGLAPAWTGHAVIPYSICRKSASSVYWARSATISVSTDVTSCVLRYRLVRDVERG